jgi:hypothetical protein
MAEIHQLKTVETTDRPAPKKIWRPCDYGLFGAVKSMETQVGTVEAYNKLCDAAEVLRARIDAGEGKQAAEMFAIDPKFIFPLDS